MVQVLQDFGNRYLLFADGTVEGWGVQKNALGSNDTVPGSLGASSRKQVLIAPGTALTSVVMLARGEDLYRARALVRSSTQPQLDGAVFSWSVAQPVAQRIAGLPKVCWISGPYAVGCDGTLWYATAVPSGSAVPGAAGFPLPAAPTVTKIGDGFWRVNESTRIWEASTSEGRTVQRIVNYRAIATDDRVFRLSGASAPVLDASAETIPPQPGPVGEQTPTGSADPPGDDSAGRRRAAGVN